MAPSKEKAIRIARKRGKGIKAIARDVGVGVSVVQQAVTAGLTFRRKIYASCTAASHFSFVPSADIGGKSVGAELISASGHLKIPAYPAGTAPKRKSRQFRELGAVNAEWELVSLCHNVLKLCRYGAIATAMARVT